jgi:CubicO group peptidase (beta-lactamase class C family)
MSAIRYLPYPILVALLFAIAALAVLVYTIVRWRAGIFVHWPYLVGGAFIVVGVLLVCVWASRPTFLTAPRTPEGADLARIESSLQDLVAAGDPPGVSVIVVRDGDVVYDESFGVAGPTGRPASSDSSYRWWSITKIVTAIAILQLEERGALELDDPVSDHLPFVDLRGPAGSPAVTIRHLLSHSSGLPDAGIEILGWIHYQGEPLPDQTALITRLLPRYSTLETVPGTEGQYTNIGYMVLAAIVERASGQAYADYVSDRILTPLGMSDTGFVEPTSAPAAVASHPVDVMTVPASFVIDLGRAVRERSEGRLWFDPVYPDALGPSGLVGTPRDLARLAAALLAEGELDGQRVLDPASVAAMAVPHVTADRTPAPPTFHIGLGWFTNVRDGRLSLTHGGQGMGTVSLMRLYPEEKLAIVVAANGTYLGPDFGMGLVDALGDVAWGDVDGLD